MTGVFAERLVAARIVRGLPAMTVADRSGIAASQISIYENGVTQPGLGNLLKISNALDVDADYLIGRTTTPVSRSAATYRMLGQISALSEHDQHLLDLFLATLDATAKGEDVAAKVRLQARIAAVRKQQRNN